MWTDKNVTDKNLRITRSTELYLEVTSSSYATSLKIQHTGMPVKTRSRLATRNLPKGTSRRKRGSKSVERQESSTSKQWAASTKGRKSHDRVRKRESTAIGGKWTRSFVRFPLSRCSAARIPALSSRHPPRSTVEGHGEETTASAFFRDTRITRRLVCRDAH